MRGWPRSGPGIIVSIPMMQTGPQRKFDLRFVAALLLLAPAVLFTWRTMDGLAKRRLLRMDQAEIDMSATAC